MDVTNFREKDIILIKEEKVRIRIFLKEVSRISEQSPLYQSNKGLNGLSRSTGSEADSLCSLLILSLCGYKEKKNRDELQ